MQTSLAVVALVLGGGQEPREEDSARPVIQLLAHGLPWPAPRLFELPDDTPRGSGWELRRGGDVLRADLEPLTAWPDGRPRWCRLEVAESVGHAAAEWTLHPVARRDRPRVEWRTRGRTREVFGEGGRYRIDREAIHCGEPPLQFVLGDLDLVLDGSTASAERIGAVRERRGAVNTTWEGEVELNRRAAEVLRVWFRFEVSSRGRFAELEVAFQARSAVRITRAAVPVRGEFLLLTPADAIEGDARTPSIEAVRAAAFDRRNVPSTVALRAPSGILHWPGFGHTRPCALRRDQPRSASVELVAADVVLAPGQVLRHRWLWTPAEYELAHRSRWRPRISTNSSSSTLPAEWCHAWQNRIADELRRASSAVDRGCLPTSHGEFGNGEYDIAASLVELGTRLGLRGWTSAGLAAARHTRDFDRAFDPPDPWPAGLLHQHGFEHQSGRLDAGHQWVGGLLVHARWSGDPESWFAAQEMGRALGELAGHTELLDGPERRLCWPLWALLELEALGLRQPAAKSYLKRLLQRVSSGGVLHGDVRRIEDEEFLWTNVWVRMGITVPVLRVAAKHMGEEKARIAAIRLAQFVVEHAPTRNRAGQMEWPEVLLLDANGEAVARRFGRPSAGETAMIALGLQSTGLPEHSAHAPELWRDAISRCRPDDPRAWTDFAQILWAARCAEVVAELALEELDR